MSQDEDGVPLNQEFFFSPKITFNTVILEYPKEEHFIFL